MAYIQNDVIPVNLLSSSDTKRGTLGRLGVQQVADLLGFQQFEVLDLVKADLLEPLGNPAPNAKLYFARVKIQKLAKDVDWLGDATDILYGHKRPLKFKGKKTAPKIEAHVET